MSVKFWCGTAIICLTMCHLLSPTSTLFFLLKIKNFSYSWITEVLCYVCKKHPWIAFWKNNVKFLWFVCKCGQNIKFIFVQRRLEWTCILFILSKKYLLLQIVPKYEYFLKNVCRRWFSKLDTMIYFSETFKKWLKVLDKGYRDRGNYLIYGGVFIWLTCNFRSRIQIFVTFSNWGILLKRRIQGSFPR